MTTCTNCLLVLAVLGYATTQYLAPPMAGTSIGTNYHTDDSSRQETIDAEGNVQGQYSYVDPNGKTINVQYTAGKDGFKIVGEHVPIPSPQVLPTIPQQGYYQPQRGYQSNYRNYNQRFGNQYPQDLQGFQSQAVYQSQEYQPKFTQALFSPAQEPYPAATAGQMKSLQEYLEEERMEIEKEKQKKKPPAQAYASVNTPTQEYSYNINL